MKLYFAPRTRATRSRWLLEELGVPYECVKLDLSKSETRTPAFLALNPLGEVPLLVDGDLTLSEPSAICLYLADRFPQTRLAPRLDSPDRGPYLQWMLFAENTLEPLVVAQLRNAQLSSEQSARLAEVLTVLDRRLHGRDFIVGDAFTAADLVTASILHLAHTLKLLETRPRLLEYVLRHTSRPATLRAVSA